VAECLERGAGETRSSAQVCGTPFGTPDAWDVLVRAMKASKVDPVVAMLNALIAHDHEEIVSCEAALSRAPDRDLDELRRMISDHRRHIARLTLLVYTLGGKPAREGDVKRAWSTGLVLLGSLLGEHAMLEVVQSREREIRGAYLDALSHVLSRPIRAVLEENLRDELKHTAWLESRLGRDERDDDTDAPASLPRPA
jgi:uncharacterized protein (TIGR02284 family)